MAVSLYAARAIGASVYDASVAILGIYEPYVDGARIGYTSGGLPAGYTDKFYAHHITITLTNYTDAILAAETTNGNLTTITLAGLDSGRDYFVACVRFDASGAAVAISPCEIIKTVTDRIEVLPPFATKTADWSTAKLNEWFVQPTAPYDNSTMFFSYYKQNDAEMGNYLRVMDDRPIYVLDANETETPFTHTFSGFVGCDGLSPRHGWHVEAQLRVADRYVPGSSGPTQLECGVTMGDQASAKASYGLSHAIYPSIGNDYPVGTDVTADFSEPEVLHWSTCYGVMKDQLDKNLLYPWAGAGWRTHAVSGPKGWARDKHTVSVEYDAAVKEATIKFNNQTLVTLGQIHDTPYRRKKFPHGHYALPARLSLEWQFLGPGNPLSYYDIGTLSYQSSCPMYYAGWSAETQVQGGLHGYLDRFAEVPYHDPSKHSLNNFWYVDNANDPTSRGRFGSAMHAGYTVTPSSPYLYEAPSHKVIHFEEMEPTNWSNYTVPTWSTDLHRGRTLPVHVPEGTRLAYVVLHGYQQYGTIVARVLDQNGVAISTDLPIISVADAQPIAIPENTATSIQIEVDIQYDGTPIDYTTMGPGGSGSSNNGDWPTQDIWRPATPPLFVGFEAYFADPLNIPEFDPTVDASLGELSLAAPATMALGTLSGTSGTVSASLGTLSLTAPAIVALGTLSGTYSAGSASLGTLALTAPSTLGLGALSGVTTAANQIRAPNGDVRVLRNVDGTIRTFNLLA